MRYRVLPYRQGSRSAKALATALGGKVLKLEGSKFVPQSSDLIINWGNTNRIAGVGVNYANHPDVITAASNKRSFFQRMREVNPDDIPQFWTDRTAIPDDAYPVVCRTVLSGHSGDGIVIAQSSADLVPAPLYVKYVKKEDEYRIHVGRITDNAAELVTNQFTVIAQQRKARRHGFENPNWQVRNHQNGFVYVRQDVHPPVSVVEAAKRALFATDLDFGAVDVIYNAKEGKAYVLEINTAPGLEGQTVTDYATFFQGLV